MYSDVNWHSLKILTNCLSIFWVTCIGVCFVDVSGPICGIHHQNIRVTECLLLRTFLNTYNHIVRVTVVYRYNVRQSIWIVQFNSRLLRLADAANLNADFLMLVSLNQVDRVQRLGGMHFAAI